MRLLLAVVLLPVVTIQAAPVVMQVSAGYSHTLFLKSDGSLWAMGDNTFGELGNGTTDSTNQPEQIISSNVTAVVASQLFSLFLKSDGSLWGMGINDFGQLGDGSTTEHHVPVQIATNVTAVAAGLFHTLFITNGSLWVMGHNNHGQLGNNSTTDSHIPIQIVPSGVTKIAAGGDHSLFIKSDGSLWAMGWNNFGQLGDGSLTERHAPVQISAAHITAIAAGEYHNLFITNGQLRAMGQNFYGQLGDGTITNRNAPVLITNGITAIAAGFDHSLFIKSDGSLWTMGYNGNGGLGDGTTDNGTYQTNSPERIVAGGVRAVAGGNAFSLFARDDGSLWAMGWNGDGELGDSTLNSTNLPEQIVAGSPPVVTLIGSASMTNECHFAFTDPGTTNVLGLPVTVTGNLNTNSPGVYQFTYTATNSLGGTGTTNRTVTVVDTTAPVITVLGANPLYAAVNTPFVDPGATALDACGGSFAVTSNSTVNLAVAGSYTNTYSATDSYNNTAMATRTVVVKTPLIVTTTNDSGVGSLRQTISNSVSGDYIKFATNLSGSTILLTNGQLTLNQNLTIDGSALPGGIQINGNLFRRIFLVAGGTANVLTALTITGGFDTNYFGGGIAVATGSKLTVNQCTITSNETFNVNLGADFGGGGGIGNDGTLILNQCTLTGNHSRYDIPDCGGGAIFNSGTLTLNQCTVTRNDADGEFDADGIYNYISGKLALINSIVADNTTTPFIGADIYDDVSFDITLSGANIVENSSHSSGSMPINAAPQLAPLGNYGGPTQTMPPLPGSPAIDACTNGTSFTNDSGVIFTTPATDQRGFPRPLGLAPDIGAVEGIYTTNGPGKLTGMTRLGNGSTRFTFTNYTDTSYTVLASTNVALPITTWTNIGPAVESPAGSGHFQFTDPQGTNNPQRFYRVSSP
jgi:alpha-tubulin suppressor-like RCC1 family protein